MSFQTGQYLTRIT